MPSSFLPNDRVQLDGLHVTGRVWRVRLDGRVDVVFDGQDVPATVGAYDIEHIPDSQPRRGTDVLGFDERERLAIRIVLCRTCGAAPGVDCTSTVDLSQRLPHPHYTRWCDVSGVGARDTFGTVDTEPLPRIPDGGPESIGRYSESEAQDIRDAGRGHLL